MSHLLEGTPIPFICSRCGRDLSTADYRSWTGARLCFECKQRELEELSKAAEHNARMNEED
jgi:hypothetical protein